MKRLKVLHVVNSLDPGGMENGVVNIIRELSSEFDFQVACLERRGPFVERLARPETAWVAGKKGGWSPLAAIRLATRIFQLRPDVIHTHNLGPLIYASLATFGGVTAPILHGEHSQLTQEECSPRRMRQRKLLYRCCSKIHTVSRSQQVELLEKGFKRIESVVNGVDANRFIPCPKGAAKARLGFAADSLVIGIVGRFGAFKRHAELLEAFECLSASWPKLHLLIVGAGGPNEKPAKRQAEGLTSKDRIHFAGFQADTSFYYQAMDFLAVPSTNEGLSNAILEAMASGIPVLAQRACGNEEVISSGHQGIVMDLDSQESLIEGLRTMLAMNAQFAQWGKSAREKVAADFSLSRMMEKYALLYRAACKSFRFPAWGLSRT